MAELTFVDGSIGFFQEDIILDATIEWWIVLIGHSWVYHDYVVLIMVMEIFHIVPYGLAWEALWIVAEYLSEVHVVW